jgi:hypothetical protein
MHPITPAEKLRAFERVRSSANSLIHDGVISETEFRILIDRAVKAFGNPYELKLVTQGSQCLTQDRPNGEPLI